MKPVSGQGKPIKLSIVMPARNEAGCLADTVGRLSRTLRGQQIPFEILVVDDGSRDDTPRVLKNLLRTIPELRWIRNAGPNGFGFAVRKGLERFGGEAVAVVMADGSDFPGDVVRFYRRLGKGDVDCVFGSRFMTGGAVSDYPRFKLLLNRVFNRFVQLLFGLRYNDVTNAFKMYRAHVIPGLHPLLSHHFNLTIELPLKAIIRGYRYVVLPNRWRNRETGDSKLRIKEMGSRYMFIVIYCFIEKWLSCGDYRVDRRQSVALSDSQRKGR